MDATVTFSGYVDEQSDERIVMWILNASSPLEFYYRNDTTKIRGDASDIAKLRAMLASLGYREITTNTAA